MNTGIFTVAGPVMVGPSSSHTAGAARLGRMAKQINNKEFDKVEFYLHGSFAKTGRGHGTDKALLAGVLGMKEDDSRIAESMEIADKKGLEYKFGIIDMENAHENSVRIKFYKNGEKTCQIEGASIGGGEILITKIDSYEVTIRGHLNTIFVRQRDKKGVIGHIASVLAKENINIATMEVARSAKSKDAMCIIEVDENIDNRIQDELADFPEIIFVKVIKPL